MSIRISEGRESRHVAVGLKVWMKWRNRTLQTAVVMGIKVIHMHFR